MTFSFNKSARTHIRSGRYFLKWNSALVYNDLYQIKMVSEAKRSKYGASKCKVKFKNCWTEIYLVRGVAGDVYKFLWIPCYKKHSCDHQGIKNVAKHCSKLHKRYVEAWKKRRNLKSFLKPSSSATKLDRQVINDEGVMINSLAQHNLPFATSDYLGFLFKSFFSDIKTINILILGTMNHVVSKQGLSSRVICTTLPQLPCRTLPNSPFLSWNQWVK